MINYVWNVLLIVGIIISIFTGKISEMGNIIMNSTNEAFEIFFNVALIILFWGGVFNIAIESGLIKNLTKICQKPLLKLYPELNEGDPALEYICSNIIANLLGLGSAATPLGLKAFEELQKINPDKTKPSRSMITFIIMNVSSFTLFPTTILGIRSMYKGSNNISLMALMIICTFLSATLAIILDRIFYLISKRKKK